MVDIESLINNIFSALLNARCFVAAIPGAAVETAKSAGLWVAHSIQAIGHFLLLVLTWLAIICGTWLAVFILAHALYFIWKTLICRRQRGYRSELDAVLRTHRRHRVHNTTIAVGYSHSRPQTRGGIGNVHTPLLHHAGLRVSSQTVGHHYYPSPPPPPRSHRVSHEYRGHQIRSHPQTATEPAQPHYHALVAWLCDSALQRVSHSQHQTVQDHAPSMSVSAIQQRTYGTMPYLPPPPYSSVVPSPPVPSPPPPSYSSQGSPPPYYPS